MTTRIAVLNNEIYRISEAKYKKIMGLGRKFDFTDDRDKLHEKNCVLIRKWGKKILEADIMLRDD